MRHMRHRWLIAPLGIVLILFVTSAALAGHGGYHLAWWTADDGAPPSIDVYTAGAQVIA